MKRTSLLIAMTVVLAAAACAPATPTVDPAQIQASAVAAANTMVALTQEALPTATPIPPTPLPSPSALPSPTMGIIPTLPIASIPTVIAAAPTTSGDPCNAPLAASPDGPKMTVSVSNSTNGKVILNLHLYKTPHGECGNWSAVMDPHGSTSAFLPQGCYWGGAFVEDPKQKSKSFSGGQLCMVNGDKFRVVVGTDTIDLK